MKILILLLALFIPSSTYGQSNAVEIEAGIPLELLAYNMGVQLARERLPQMTMMDKGYVVISRPSKEISNHGLTCAEVYYDANELGVMLLIGFHVVNPFVQIAAQHDGYFTVVILRPVCIEGVNWFMNAFEAKGEFQ